MLADVSTPLGVGNKVAPPLGSVGWVPAGRGGEDAQTSYEAGAGAISPGPFRPRTPTPHPYDLLLGDMQSIAHP